MDLLEEMFNIDSRLFCNWDWHDYSVCPWQYLTFVGMGLLYSHDIPNYPNRDRFLIPTRSNERLSCRIEALTKKMEIIWINTRLVKSSCGKLCVFAEQCEDKFEWNQVTGEVNVWRVSKRPWTSFNNLWSRMRLPSLGRMHFRDGWSLFCCEKMVRRNCDDICLVVLTQSSYGFAMNSHVPIICSE